MASGSLFLGAILLFSFATMAFSDSLSPYFYHKVCPQALPTIRRIVFDAVRQERRMGASLLRLHFHDCFVNLGGPSWEVQLGRRDSTTASKTLANNDIPSPFMDLPALINSFSKQGLNVKDLVALSGGHTLGFAQCRTFRNRIYNETNIDKGFAAQRQATCPRVGGDSNLAPLDPTPAYFDTKYFSNLVRKKGLLHSDQALFNGGQTDSLVKTYSGNIRVFAKDFAKSMVKMGNIKPLTGKNGQIRVNCRKVN
nr:peroxidase 2-like [Ipomoea batatas]